MLLITEVRIPTLLSGESETVGVDGGMHKAQARAEAGAARWGRGWGRGSSSLMQVPDPLGIPIVHDRCGWRGGAMQ